MVSDIDNATISFFFVFFVETLELFHAPQHLDRERTTPFRADLFVEAERAACYGGTQPPIHTQLRCCVVWFDFTISRRGGGLVSCKHALSLLSSVNTLTGTHTHTYKCGFVVEEGGARSKRGIYDMTSSERVDGVLCHALFGFPALTAAARTPALGKHVREEALIGARGPPHTSCQSHFQRGNASLVTDKVLC